jgi:anhydro-N-acetylmuramic acid kinase
MSATPQLYIGLMSGTSMDGIDAALVSFDDRRCQLINTIEYTIPESLRQQLLALSKPGDNEIDRLGSADRELAQHFAEASKQLINTSNILPAQVLAIGSHGQTIRHRPNHKNPFTLQIGDPNTIAQLTGITTVADFRRRDIAAGGQGAPLAPIFHQAMFGSSQCNRAIINIGGMSNITLIDSSGVVSGYDTGPGNVLMDSWIQRCKGENYDHDGNWAASGVVIPSLVDKLLGLEFFSKSPPKSTGREEFNLEWLNQCIDGQQFSSADIQASLLELTAQTIASEVVNQAKYVDEIYICGGGAYNTILMERLKSLTQPRLLGNTSLLGIPAEWVEASAFAWLPKQTMENIKAKVSPITGASEATILGGIYSV